MRVVFVVVGLLGLLCPAVALAQAPAAPAPAAPAAAATSPAPAASAAARRGGDITRDQYVERAKAAAERRFDAMDADHDGVLTAEERRAYRESHSRRRGAEPAAAPQPAKPK